MNKDIQTLFGAMKLNAPQKSERNGLWRGPDGRGGPRKWADVREM